MATLTIPDETYGRLVRRAAKLRVTLEDLVVPLLESEPEATAPVPELQLKGGAWQRAHDDLMRDAAEWTKHLPPDLELDLDYYREREDAQS